MSTSMYSGVSGLRSQQTRLDVIGNNIANLNTIGYKGQRVNFSDLLSQTISGASGPNAATNQGGTNPEQVGLGVGVAAVDTNMGTGSTQSTGIGTDLSIGGAGFFIIQGKGSGDYKFTRAGNFGVDKSGNLNIGGELVCGWENYGGAAQANGTYTFKTQESVQPINIYSDNVNGNKRIIPPKATASAALAGNLDPAKTARSDATHMNDINNGVAGAQTSYPIDTSSPLKNPDATSTMTVYDTMGNSYNVQVNFAKCATGADNAVAANYATYIAAKTNSNFLNNAATTYGGTTTLNSAAATALTDKDTAETALAASTDVNVTTALSALEAATPYTTDYDTKAAALAAAVASSTDPADAANYATYIAAKTTSNSLNKAVTTYGGTTTLNSAAATALTDKNTAETALAASTDANVTTALSALEAATPYTTDYDTKAATLATAVASSGATTWYWEADSPANLAGTASKNCGYIEVDSSGKIITTDATNYNTKPIITLTPQGTNAGSAAFNVALDLTGISSYVSSGGYSISPTSVDGYKAGDLSDISIGSDGMIMGIYNNGQKQPLGMIALANFDNPGGLEKSGSNMYVTTANSGNFTAGLIAGTGGTGKLTAGTLEGSNVDMAGEFSDMMMTQRAYQANSKIITVSDQMMQTLTDMIRA